MTAYTKLKTKEEYRVESVADAKALIEDITTGQKEEGYILVSAGQAHKTKKKNKDDSGDMMAYIHLPPPKLNDNDFQPLQSLDELGL